MIAPEEKRLRSMLERRGPGGAWTFLRVPFDVNKSFGSRGLVSVAGTINNSRFRSSIFPEGDGTHIFWVNKELQQRARVKAGDFVQVSLAQDLAKRAVSIPSQFKQALAQNKQARATFLKLSYGRKTSIADHIRRSKTGATRNRRTERALRSLSADASRRKGGERA